MNPKKSWLAWYVNLEEQLLLELNDTMRTKRGKTKAGWWKARVGSH